VLAWFCLYLFIVVGMAFNPSLSGEEEIVL
jgi:hypothetical protein